MVNEIRIYVEGGGPANRTQSRLREGFDAFCQSLKSLAKQADISLRFIAAGSRDEAFHDFKVAMKIHRHACCLLLVDSETEVNSKARAHLQKRDRWDLSVANEDQVHLMAQCMEAWLVADPEALADYYDQGFNGNALPQRNNLEEEPKVQIYAALDNATRHTQKGSYGKIKHASELLKKVSAEKAKNRCVHCRRFFESVANKIKGEG